jgi:hypothetical protein
MSLTDFNLSDTLILSEHELHNILDNYTHTYFITLLLSFWNYWGEYYLFKHNCLNNEYNCVRIWKANTWTSWWTSRMPSYNSEEDTLAVDFYYETYSNAIKIEYISEGSYDEDSKTQWEKEAKNIHKIEKLIKYVENHAREKGINKIILDLHGNVQRYNLTFFKLGFKIGNKCKDNPYWVETYKMIDENLPDMFAVKSVYE